jgi:hypothetical protein
MPALRRGGFGQGAEVALGEALGGDVVDAVKTSAGIFPSDYGSEFDELTFGEVLAERGVEFIGDVGGNASEIDGEAKDHFFHVVEIGAGFELTQIVKLLFGDAGFSAHGRVDIDSKRTANEHGHFELGEFFQVERNGAFGGGVHVKATSEAEIFGVEGANGHACGELAYGSFGEEEQDAREKGWIRIAFGARHWHLIEWDEVAGVTVIWG